MSDNTNKKTWKDKITTFIAITTLLLAACATLSAFKAAGYGNRMVLAQSQASDQWAYYQAKSIKETTYKVQRDSLAAMTPAALRNPEVVKQLQIFDREVERYRQERTEIEQAAKKLEQERDMAQKYNNVLGQALMFLQVGILLSSLAAINKTYLYWYVGSGVGSVGIGFFLYAVLIL
ncbi:DUF4337 domain-containing protein [Azotosporobacter soli]|uniref:DUF4337 domain-containing protein n=1 Tax=Azotosporobacter soli TaxID=3055040 RepID=UPI0031FF2D51